MQTKRNNTISRLAWLFAACLALFLSASEIFAQGCLAVRGSGSCAHAPSVTDRLPEATHGLPWEVSLGVRWFRSDRHFSGDRELNIPSHRVAENVSLFYDFSVRRQLSPRYAAAVILPFVDLRRTTTYEHDGIHRHTTHASGIGDLRLAGFAWLLDPARSEHANVWVGAGVKFPTGDHDVQDTFHTTNGSIRRAVDQSIQPGDSGYGFTLEAYGFYRLTPAIDAYAQGFYLFNPESENGVLTDIAGDDPYGKTMSITDQYLIRVGVHALAFPEQGLSLNLGCLIEGVPAEDFFGENEGFRRPGYAVSVEPGVTLQRERWRFSLSTPVAVYRNRIRGFSDAGRTGDAAFADYLVSGTITLIL